MSTVANLLSKPLFHDFRLVSGKNGLNNKVTSAGFFEWEQDSQITKSFSKGEFVITTLSSLRGEPEAVNRSLKLLISNQVAAIAIKDVYFNDVNDEIKAYSNERSVPIMFFTETFIDEVLYEVKNETLNKRYNSFNEIVLDSLILNDNLDNLEKENLLRKINPFFHSGSIICAYISNREDTVSISQETLDFYNNILLDNAIAIPDKIDSVEFVYSFLSYKRGILLISTTYSTDSNILQKYKSALMDAFGCTMVPSDISTGLSDFTFGFEDIGNILLRAIFANTSAILDGRKVVEISAAPFDHFIFKDRYLPEPSMYYENMLAKLSESASQRSPLLETLITLVSCDGNVDKTAKEMFQHKNTIRYRMNKLRSIFSATGEMEFYSKIHFFYRIHFSKPFLDSFFKKI